MSPCLLGSKGKFLRNIADQSHFLFPASEIVSEKQFLLYTSLQFLSLVNYNYFSLKFYTIYQVPGFLFLTLSFIILVLQPMKRKANFKFSHFCCRNGQIKRAFYMSLINFIFMLSFSLDSQI